MQLGASAVQRIDSTTRSRARYAAIQGFKDPASPLLLFLMAVRSCGLGTDLPRVDVVLLLDSDWHPLLDIQVRYNSGFRQLWVGLRFSAVLKRSAQQPNCCCCNKLVWTGSSLLLCTFVTHTYSTSAAGAAACVLHRPRRRAPRASPGRLELSGRGGAGAASWLWPRG